MAKLRYIGSDTVDVPVLGRSVEPDQVVEVPDDLLENRVWPESLWTEVKSSKKTAASKDEE